MGAFAVTDQFSSAHDDVAPAGRPASIVLLQLFLVLSMLFLVTTFTRLYLRISIPDDVLVDLTRPLTFLGITILFFLATSTFLWVRHRLARPFLLLTMLALTYFFVTFAWNYGRSERLEIYELKDFSPAGMVVLLISVFWIYRAGFSKKALLFFESCTR